MLNDRGFDTTKYDNFSREQIDILYKTNPKVTKDINPIDIELNQKTKLLIKYMLTSKIRVNNIQNVLDEILEDGNYNENDTVILIIKDKLTSQEAIEMYFDIIYDTKKVFVQLFNLDMLMYNVSKHVKVPKHEIVSKEEKDAVFKKYNLETFDQLPVILKIDPVAKYYGMKRGDVVKITIPSETHGMFVKHRYCQ